MVHAVLNFMKSWRKLKNNSYGRWYAFSNCMVLVYCVVSVIIALDKSIAYDVLSPIIIKGRECYY